MGFRTRLGYHQAPIEVLKHIDQLAMDYETTVRARREARWSLSLASIEPAYRDLAQAELLAIDLEEVPPSLQPQWIRNYLELHPERAHLLEAVHGHRLPTTNSSQASTNRQRQPAPQTANTRTWNHGDILNDYRLLRRLDGSEKAATFRAEHHWLGTKAIIKLWLNPMRDTTKTRVAFRRALFLAKQLNSPLLVRTFDLGKVADWYYLVLESIEGVRIKPVIENLGPVSPQVATALVAPIAQYITSSRNQNHSLPSIDPSDLIVTETGCVKLVNSTVRNLLIINDDLPQAKRKEANLNLARQTNDDVADFADAADECHPQWFDLASLLTFLLTGNQLPGSPSTPAQARHRVAQLARIPLPTKRLLCDMLRPHHRWTPDREQAVSTLLARSSEPVDLAQWHRELQSPAYMH